jgi:acetoin utilization protein AcuB
MVEQSSAAKNPAVSRVRDYMTVDPQTLGSEHSLLDAVLLVRRANLRHIPIMQDGQVVGVLTDRDIARASPSLLVPLPPDEYNRVFESTEVSKVMSRNPLTTTPDALLSEAAELLFANRLGCLPVVEKGKLVGIITISDMLRALRDLITLESQSAPSSQESAGQD